MLVVRMKDVFKTIMGFEVLKVTSVEGDPADRNWLGIGFLH